MSLGCSALTADACFGAVNVGRGMVVPRYVEVPASFEGVNGGAMLRGGAGRV